MATSNPITARKLTEDDLDLLNAILNTLTDITPLQFIQDMKQNAISLQQYQQAAMLRDIEKHLLKRFE